MTASIASGIKTALVTLGVVSERVFADEAPSGSRFPYITLDPDVSDIPRLSGDGGKAIARQQLVQVNLWEDWGAEDVTHRRRIVALFNGSTVACDDGLRRCHVENVIRLYERDTRRVHTAIDVFVDYTPAAV